MEAIKAEPGTDTRAKYLEAVRLVDDVGLSVTKACEKAGIARPTYYLYQASQKEKGPAATGPDSSLSPEGSNVTVTNSLTQNEPSPTPTKKRKEA